ncbi:glycogen synthase [Sphingobacterium hungaricum]|uniref:Glycogen synthase n=1 Tax=Sphingobacterium hungaricum TaxID=2082723 RepID=A0A928YNT7_9SPHI|nr:glycogen/starch synthase [Sphingobacterium hungaricum]MBE8712406.1 glycogen synthase [Sphingobacterium hungaricum]
MKVIHFSVECYPIAKVGGLADVVGALPKYQRKLGIDASLIMPWYNKPFVQNHEFDLVATGAIYQGSELLNYEILKEKDDVLGFPVYLVKIPGKLDRDEVYMYPDEAEQWIAFQHASLHYLKTNGIMPDVMHCHDHHVGLIPFLTKHTEEFRSFNVVKTIATVHNGQYHGTVNWNKGILLPQFDTWKWGLLDWDGFINPLATAIKCCDSYTTVSEGYLKELFNEANGLDQLFYAERSKGYGIVNGIDTDIWNPATDTLISPNYTIKGVKKGKTDSKKAFAKKYGLDPSKPLMAYIGRFAGEKGADILPSIIKKLFSNANNNLIIFILGSGEAETKEGLENLLPDYVGKFACFFGYNESLAHEVYAAADLLIMPSRVEPCGLNQLYALKYGTLPIVRNTGGLKDTVIDVENNGYGFVFDEVNADEAVVAIERALGLVEDKPSLDKTRKMAMELDFSWDQSAAKYVELYNRILN